MKTGFNRLTQVNKVIISIRSLILKNEHNTPRLVRLIKTGNGIFRYKSVLEESLGLDGAPYKEMTLEILLSNIPTLKRSIARCGR